MFQFGKEESPAAKCIISRALLPRYIDPGQIPTKKKPFSVINGQSFSHTVDLVLPQELYDVVWEQIESKISTVQYSRVIMPLSALLEGQFFNLYIKSGNIAMLSEGRPGVDKVYSLKDGVLRLELPKEVYERVGLVGTPIRDGGRKHLKSRYVIEINLRLPSMVHGKKGFERIVWAFKNVLDASVSWLFHDFNEQLGGQEKDDSPITPHHPLVKIYKPNITHLETLAPLMVLPTPDDFDEEQLEIIEWLDLVVLDSPRIRAGDTIDPFLSRYEVPRLEQVSVSHLVKVTWHGFICAEWIRNLYLQLFWSRKDSSLWHALSVKAFKMEPVDWTDGYTILTIPSEDAEKDGRGTLKQLEEGSEATGQVAYAIWELTTGACT